MLGAILGYGFGWYFPEEGERIKGGGNEGRREGEGGMSKILTWKLEYSVLINM